MNEQENIRLVQEGYQYFTSGDIDNLLKTYTEDITFVFHGSSDLTPFHDTFRGKEEVKQFFLTVNDTLEFELYENLDFIGQGDKVIVFGHDKSRTRNSGKKIEEHRVHVFTVQQGKTSRLESYGDATKMMAGFALHQHLEV
jgi:uncharacterized protein